MADKHQTATQIAAKVQTSLHLLAVELGSLMDEHRRLRKALLNWKIETHEELGDAIILPLTPELLSLLPSKGKDQ